MDKDKEFQKEIEIIFEEKINALPIKSLKDNFSLGDLNIPILIFLKNLEILK